MLSMINASQNGKEGGVTERLNKGKPRYFL